MDERSPRLQKMVDVFESMFPEMAQNTAYYKMFQRDIMVVILKDGRTRLFLYKNDDDWQLGTKLYRANPRMKGPRSGFTTSSKYNKEDKE